MTANSQSLRAKNLRWLCALIALDIAILVVSASQPVIQGQLNALSTVTRYGLAAFLPVVVLVLSSLLSSATKDVLVFWRHQHALPGHRAFSQLVHRDPRIDTEDLRLHVGEFPSEPAKQNALWYKLYSRVREDTIVLESHKLFLLFRDAATVSLLLVMASAGLLLAFHLRTVAGIAALIFAVQYLLAMIAARHQAERFVCNVLVLHAQRSIP